MKNLILILVIAIFFSCKKNSKMATPVQPNIWCVFYKQTCTGCQPKVFYKCASTKEEMQKACVDLRNSNKEYEVVVKATCSDCN